MSSVVDLNQITSEFNEHTKAVESLLSKLEEERAESQRQLAAYKQQSQNLGQEKEALAKEKQEADAAAALAKKETAESTAAAVAAQVAAQKAIVAAQQAEKDRSTASAAAAAKKHADEMAVVAKREADEAVRATAAANVQAQELQAAQAASAAVAGELETVRVESNSTNGKIKDLTTQLAAMQAQRDVLKKQIESIRMEGESIVSVIRKESLKLRKLYKSMSPQSVAKKSDALLKFEAALKGSTCADTQKQQDWCKQRSNAGFDTPTKCHTQLTAYRAENLKCSGFGRRMKADALYKHYKLSQNAKHVRGLRMRFSRNLRMYMRN